MTFAATAFGLTRIAQFAFLALGWPMLPALVIEIATFVDTATTHRIEGRSGVRRLFASTLRWRLSARWCAVALVVIPSRRSPLQPSRAR